MHFAAQQENACTVHVLWFLTLHNKKFAKKKKKKKKREKNETFSPILALCMCEVSYNPVKYYGTIRS